MDTQLTLEQVIIISSKSVSTVMALTVDALNLPVAVCVFYPLRAKPHSI